MPSSNLRRASVAVLALIACIPLPGSRAVAGQVRVSAESRPATADLPPEDVVRLTEEAGWLAHETKSSGRHPGLASLRAGHPASVSADSIHSYDAIHYLLEVTPSRTSNVISGTMTLDLNVVDPGIAEIDLNAPGLQITATRVNGLPRTFSIDGEKLLVPVCEGAECPSHGVGDPLQVAVDYSASTPQLGFYYYARNSYTMAEPFEARYWWPCYDLPNDKATLDVIATVPETDLCVSNGSLISLTAGPPGTRVWHWQELHQIATYLVAITVGQYVTIHQNAGPLAISHYVFPEDSAFAAYDFQNVPAMFPIFAGRWGPYPFDSYGQIAVTPFAAGGMEHQSITTINRSWITGNQANEVGVAHELAHQWWGDMVTLVDFRHIWLNEGFASYGECVWRESAYGASAYNSYVQSQMSSALTSDNNFRYALYDPPAANLFGNTIYKKGSLVLHMLRRVLGDAAFFSGMQLYGQRFQYGNASTADFEQAMEDASGQPLAWFFNEWVYDKGLPTYNWGWQSASIGGGQTSVGVQIRQVQTNAPYFRMPIELKLLRSGLPDTTITVTNDAIAIQNMIFTINGTPTNVVFDPRNSIYKRIQQVTVDAPSVIPDAGPALFLTASPNPARVVARLQLRLGAIAREPVRLTIFDSGGRAVRSLAPRTTGGPATDIAWDLRDDAGRRVAPGLYFAQARVGANHEERAITVLR